MAAGHEVTIPARAGEAATPAYAQLPDGARRGMVVIHEAFGRQPEIDRVVTRLALAGFAAVAPDLFASAPRVICLAQAARQLARGEGPLLDRVQAARAWLAREAAIPASRVGLIGFCLGGKFALVAGRGWGAVSANYCAVPSIERLEGIGPTIACFGGRDRVLGERSAAALDERLAQLGVPHEVHVFPSVGHSFLTDGDHPVATALTAPLLRIGYDPIVAEEAWGRIMGFLDRHLPTPGSPL